MYQGNFRQKEAPVNVGDELDVTIEAVGEKGDGIAKKEGFVLFVPNTQEGQTVKIRVTKVLRKVGFADVVGDADSAPQGEQQPEQAPESEEQTQEEAPEAEPQQDSEDFGEEENKEVQ